jgi:LysM repeat protein
MALADKYGDVLGLAQQLGVRDGNWKEEGGKIHMWGTTDYQLEANQLWDKIKEHSNWENEVVANIQADKKDLFGVYTVQSGDSLSKIAQRAYGDAKRYPTIFEANRDQLKDPDKIQVGQKLKIPNP